MNNKQLFKSFKFLFMLLMISSLNSKAQNTVYFPQVFFDKIDAINKLNLGASTIKGVAFTRQDRGNFNSKKQLANKTLVFLFPMTNYMEEWLKLYKSKGENPNTNIVMSEESFKYHLEVLTDEYGNFTFTKMKPGKYYIMCDIDFVGTSSYSVETGRTNYYNGYGYYIGSTPIYQNYFYNYDDKNRESKEVEVEQNGQLIEIKLKPQLFENYAKLANKFISTTKCYQINNLQYGKCSEFYENGTIKTIAEWNKGLLDGDAIFYFEKGNIEAEGKFKKDSKIGLWKYYDENGSLKIEESFIYKNKKSVKEGIFKYYYPSGKIKIIDSYKNDLVQGESFEYYESGKLKVKYNFKDSKLDGNIKYYDENEKNYQIIEYKVGKEIKKTQIH